MSKTNDPFFQGGRYGGKTAMQLEGLSVILNMPKALESRYDANGREVEQGLPPYNPRAAFQVDDYPAAPKEWLRSEPGQLSFMVPVVEEYGMWLDFNHNFEHSHDVAVVVSTQGVNAVTGLKTDAMRLEQYRDKCPVHNVPFGGNRRCEQCGFDWPSQNYLATTACRRPYLWLDGFRASNGETRQWVFTKDEDRSVAKAIIGAERVHALGIAFFLSKEPKPTPPPMSRLRSRGIATLGGGGFASATYGGATRSLRMGPEECVDPVERFEIAAGAKIDQKIYPDPKDLNYWQEQPAGVIIINYTDPATLLAVLESGKDARVDEGFLGSAGIPLGHDPNQT